MRYLCEHRNFNCLPNFIDIYVYNVSEDHLVAVRNKGFRTYVDSKALTWSLESGIIIQLKGKV